MAKHGIDISKWQGSVDFKKVKQDGIEFAILREGYRQSVDGKFFEYVDGCKKAGIVVPGVYHFLYCASEDETRAEAASCVANIKKAGLPPTTIIFADLEYDTVTQAAKRGVAIGKDLCTTFTRIFLEEVKKAGYRTGIYSNIDYYKRMYDHALLVQHIFWLADYTGSPDYPCMFQQYTSKGKVNGIAGNVDMNWQFQELTEEKGSVVMSSRQKVVDLITSWKGLNEADGSHKQIIDIYNGFNGKLPRGTKMQYDWAWCACTWSALAVKLGYTDVMPIEISCYYLIEEAKKKGCWVEQDNYVPAPGDAVLYDWDDGTNYATTDNMGAPEHVGTVVAVDTNAGTFTVIEGNYSNSVKQRTMAINGRYIRGFIVPKYSDNGVQAPVTVTKSVDDIAKEVLAGLWGNSAERKSRLEASGYEYNTVQKRVTELATGGAPSSPVGPAATVKKVVATNPAQSRDDKIAGAYVTTTALNMRNGAGTKHKSLVVIPAGHTVNCYGYYSMDGSTRWYYIQTQIDGVVYTGFSSSKYLKGGNK